jgi:CheY-like chemotaxis protein
MAIRGYYESPLHAEPWIESALDVKDRNGNPMPGYGWIFPVGDGTVNVGAGLLDTFTGFTTVNTSKLMEAFVATAPARWGISPETSCGPPTGGKLPTGGSVLPKVGPTWIVAGDAAGSINPFNGEGIAYGYETGRMAADAVSEALRTGDGLALARSVREAQGQAYVPVIVVSGNAQEMLETRAFTEDVTDYFDKALGHGALAAFIRGYVQPAPIEGARILYVEDDDFIRMDTAEMLQQSGHRVSEAGSAEEALAKLSPDSFDLLLTDVGLPGLSGAELAKKARALDPQLPVIFATGNTSVAGFEADQSALVLLKPYSQADLAAAVLRQTRPR